ncbi:hypothetical protein CORC01_13407 [Colletotrichum orchidophilum]|uniref:Uncharacterized protein n=1 Tax=Colletotrichum orchidophilum TaxID=1209926 RepID=A0A1G4AQJ8_9PEZI|nr:uncharacterized protein CORC01_13407 [Colletotrichum orchidophilum]OHE91292.1 hypothetical protein CORC01_13407 [Colletotrichum orchidophilum]
MPDTQLCLPTTARRWRRTRTAIFVRATRSG